MRTEPLSVCRLDGHAALPAWPGESGFVSVTRAAGELSVVCPTSRVPPDVPREDGFVRFELRGPLDFSVIGVLAELTVVLARAGVSVFVICTYDTDHLLVKQADVDQAVVALLAGGHAVAEE